eukprot:4938152-Pleurochrysis_carterae.AAC.1
MASSNQPPPSSASTTAPATTAATRPSAAARPAPPQNRRRRVAPAQGCRLAHDHAAEQAQDAADLLAGLAELADDEEEHADSTEMQ